MAEDQLVNKVAQSGLVTFDLEKLLSNTQWEYLDLKPFLVKEMVLMEKPFRASVKEFDWSQFKGKWIALYCSVDTLIPHWAYMLITSELVKAEAKVFSASGDKQEDQKTLLKALIHDLDASEYQDQRVILKGCGNLQLDASFYVACSQKFLPYVKTLMYGEPCSTVPVYKKPKK